MFRTCRTGYADWSKFRPYHYAHRGLHDIQAGIPENTMPAFRRAIEHGFGVELDVHLTADNQLIVIHDSNLKRLCGVDRKANELTAKEYQQYGILGTDHRAPLFKDVLALFEGKTPMIVEIKVDGNNAKAVTEAACRMLDQYHVTYCMESFHPQVLLWLRKHRPDIIRGQLSYNYMKQSDETLPAPIRKIMTNLYSNVLTHPDFIAYRFSDRSYPAVHHCVEKYGAQEVSWTITDQNDLETAEQDGALVIFEGFIPK